MTHLKPTLQISRSGLSSTSNQILDGARLKQIVQPLGTLRRLDEVTVTWGKVSNKAMFDRVLVQVDTSKELIHGVCIQFPENQRFQKFRFENLPPTWTICCKLTVQHIKCSFCNTARGKAVEPGQPPNTTGGDYPPKNSSDDLEWITGSSPTASSG